MKPQPPPHPYSGRRQGQAGHALQVADLKHLSLKTALLLALDSAKCVSDIHTLTTHPSCTQFTLGQTRVSLKPNPACVLKVVGHVCLLSCQHSPTPLSLLKKKKVCICSVLFEFCMYIWTRLRLFITWAGTYKERRITKQGLRVWGRKQC